MLLKVTQLWLNKNKVSKLNDAQQFRDREYTSWTKLHNRSVW